MSRAVNSPPATTHDDSEQPPKLELSATQLAGSALASVTTAVAASRFGVTGTVTGAAFGSVLSGVAAAVYAASLKHATYRIKTTRTLVLKSGEVTAVADTTVRGDDPAALPPELSGRAVSLPGATESPVHGEMSTSRTYGRPRRARRSVWKPVVLLAGFAFVVSIAALGVFETAIGHPIANSKDTGTSIGTVLQQVSGGGSDSTPTPSSTRTRSDHSSPTPSDGGSSATDSPTAGDSNSPVPTPTGSAAPPSNLTSPTPAASSPAGAVSPGPTG